MKKLFFALTIIALSLPKIQAQSTLGFSINGFLPTGELRNDSPEIWGGGFSTDVAVQIRNSPIHLGGIFSMTRYGSEVREGYHGPDLGDVRVRRNNSFANLSALLRIKPPTKIGVQPYIDFTTGLSYIYTVASFRDSAWDEPWDRVLDQDDFVLNYGLGVGVEIYLNDYLSFDTHLRSTISNRAQYLTPQSVFYDHENEWYDMTVRDSRFNYLTFGIGIKVLLSYVEEQ